MDYKYNDGGRASTGNLNETNDCVARALSIVMGPNSYGLARIMVEPLKRAEGVDVLATEFMHLTYGLGFVYAQAPVGKFKIADLPKDETFIAHTHTHVSAVVNGVVNDTYDPREETLKGYWLRASSKGYNVYKGDAKLNSWGLNFAGAVKMASLYYLNYDRNTLITIKPIV